MAENKEKKVLNVPNLRFPEFEGEWEICKLSDLCTFFSGGTPNSSNKDFYGGKIAFIRSGELHANKTELFVTQKGFESSSAKMVDVGDLLLAMYGATSGDIAISKIKGAINQAILCIRTKQNKKFIESVWNKHVSKILMKYLQGGQGNLSTDIVKSLSFSFPTLAEQERIAKLMALLDERISTQNKIIDKLQSLIKGIRHDIFNDIQGEVLALSNIADIYQPQTISSSDLTTEGYWVYGANGIIGKYEEYNHETEQICITCRGNTCGTVNYTQPKVWITGNSMVINTDKYQRQVNKRFLFHYLSSYNFNSIVSGSGQPQIVRTPLEKIKVVLPTIEKQVRIANSIDIVSEKIDTESLVLRLLENQKQYLLRQMFI